MPLVRVPDFLEQGGCPCGVAGDLVAAVAVGGGGEGSSGLGGDGHGAAGGEGEEGVAFDGVDDGEGVPHLLACVAVAAHVNLLDGVGVCPADVGDDLLGRVFDGIASFAGGEDDVDVAWPEFEEGLGEADALGEVVFDGFDGVAEDTAHDVEAFDFAAHEFHAVEGGVGVGA